jgi:hypothetical protein
VRVALSMVWRVSQQRGVDVGRDMGGGEGDESEGEKVAAAARGESGRRLREEASFPTKY